MFLLKPKNIISQIRRALTNRSEILNLLVHIFRISPNAKIINKEYEDSGLKLSIFDDNQSKWEDFRDLFKSIKSIKSLTHNIGSCLLKCNISRMKQQSKSSGKSSSTERATTRQ